MRTARTSAGDPARTLALLWRATADRSRPGPKPVRSVDDVVAAATVIADTNGLDAVTIRAVARRLSIAPMTVYTHVPGKAALLDCMLDDAYLRMHMTETAGQPWRHRVAAVADDNRRLYRAHPWAVTISTPRPPLGPGQLAKYEHELAAFDDTDIDDVTRDSALTFVLDFVRIVTLAEVDAVARQATSGVADQQWWDVAGSLLATYADASAYPLASRIGTATGAAHGTTYDVEHAYHFGLTRVLDGLAPILEAGPASHGRTQGSCTWPEAR